MESLKLISKVTKSLKNSDDFDDQIKETVELVGDTMDISKICVFLGENKNIMRNAFEWCSSFDDASKQITQEMKFEDLLLYKDIFIEKGYICSSDMQDLPQIFIDLIKSNQVKSLVICPLIIDETVIGFMGFGESKYERKWKPQELEILKIISEIIALGYRRRRFEHNIAISETNFNNFFESIDEMVIISDLDKEILHCNDAVIDKLGYSMEELKGKFIKDLHPIGFRDKASTIVGELIMGERDYCPLELESKDGRTYLVETRIWFGKWGHQDCIYSVSKDVTKENESLELFSKIFESNPLPMIITTRDEKRITRVNAAFTDKTGYSDKETIGKDVHEVGMFPDPSDIIFILNELEEKGQMKNEEFVIKNRDGSLINGLFSIEPINNQGKKSWLVVMVDITKQVELTKSMEDKYKKLTNVIEGANLGTWEWNIQTGELEVNERWAEMLGYSLDEIGDKREDTWRKFAHPEDLKDSDRLIEKHLNGETEFYDFEIRVKHKGGSWVWVHDKGKIIERDDKGHPSKIFGTHSDITFRKTEQ